MNNLDELRKQLLSSRQEVLHRVTAIQKDLRNETNPIEKDSQEQALQLENDEVLGALDEGGRQMLIKIDRALKRMQDGEYGICAGCGTEIPAARLTAIPYTDLCVDCAELEGK